jgi:hypothetical protein
LAVAAAAPSSYEPAYKAPASYAAPSYKDNKYADITVTSQSDVRNLDGSGAWRYLYLNYFDYSSTVSAAKKDD